MSKNFFAFHTDMDYKTKMKRSQKKTKDIVTSNKTKNLILLEGLQQDLEKVMRKVTTLIQELKIELKTPLKEPRFIIEKSRRLDKPILVLMSTKEDKREAEGDLMNLFPRLQSMGGELRTRTKLNF